MGLEDRLIATIEHPQTGEEIPYGILGLTQDSYAGPTINLSLTGGSSATVNYVCRWAQMAQFCEAVVGVNYVDAEDGEDRLFRSVPLQFQVRGLRGMYAVRTGAITGIAGTAWTGGSPGAEGTTSIELPTWRAGQNLTLLDGYSISASLTAGDIMYEFAVVPVEFSPVPYAILQDSDIPPDDGVPAQDDPSGPPSPGDPGGGDPGGGAGGTTGVRKEWMRYLTVERTPRVELLNIKGGTLYWIDTPPLAQPEAVPTDIPVRVQSVDYVVTWHSVPFVITDFDAFIGYSNSNTKFLAGHPQVPVDGFERDRMLLLGVREVLQPSPFSLDSVSFKNLYQYSFFFQDKFNFHNNSLRRVTKANNVFDKFAYNDFSFTGRKAKRNTDRAIKWANLAQLFMAR
jgi:hypothetical protein